MRTMNFDQLWEAVKTLTPVEMARLRNLLDSLMANQEKSLTREDELDQSLLKHGLLNRIPPPISDRSAFQGWKPVEISGKPLSETIVEERR